MDEEEIKRRIIFGVGYGQPPQHSQFKKGQSGNPKGRPKKVPVDVPLAHQPTLKAVHIIANSSVRLREDGQLTEVSARDALIKATWASALKGNARSQSLAFDLLRNLDRATAKEMEEEYAFWQEYKRKGSALIDDAKRRGAAIPHLLPHPDDIYVDEFQGTTFLGPVNERQEAMVNETVRYRDALIMQDVLDRRRRAAPVGEHGEEPSSAELLAVLLERSIPERLRLSKIEWAHRSMTYEAMTIRDLLKLVFQAWQKLGSQRPRGYVFPAFERVKNKLDRIVLLVAEIKQQQIDPAEMSHDDWQEAVDRVMDSHPKC